MKSAELLARARRSATSAKLLFDSGDVNGACNRAYYAMFDAGRAALLAGDEPIKSESSRTHSGLITAFSLHLIKAERIPAQYGKSLCRCNRRLSRRLAVPALKLSKSYQSPSNIRSDKFARIMADILFPPTSTGVHVGAFIRAERWQFQLAHCILQRFNQAGTRR